MDDQSLTQQIAIYIQNRAQAKIELLDKEWGKIRKEAASKDEAERAVVEIEYNEKKQKILAEHEPEAWLTDAAKRANQIAVVTHALKFTHTDAKGSSFYHLAPHEKNPSQVHVSTACTKCAEHDIVGNAAALDVGALLSLKYEDNTLLSLLASGDVTALRSFTKDDNLLNEWLQGFSQVLSSSKLQSHTLAKQLYFPISAEAYHLISPLYASSLSHEVYSRIHHDRYSEVAKNTRKMKKDNLPSDQVDVRYLNLAIQTFGGTKPQNVSRLNSKRGGKAYLLNCEPPHWKVRRQLPLGGEDAFWQMLDWKAKELIATISNFLNKVKEFNNVHIRDKRAGLVNNLVDILMNTAAGIQYEEDRAGWSKMSNLIDEEQLWLDPHRQEEEFQNKRKKGDWQHVVCKQFSLWFNLKLKKAGFKVGDSEYQEWMKLIKPAVLELEKDLEAISS